MIQNPEDTKRLIAASLAFHKTAELLFNYKEVFHWPPFYTNLFYSIELSFKAFLASRGQDRAQLKKLNHSLQKLLTNSEQAGLVVPNPRFRELIAQIDGRLFDLRYLEGGGILVVEATEALELVWQHFVAVCAFLPVTDFPDWGLE